MESRTPKITALWLLLLICSPTNLMAQGLQTRLLNAGVVLDPSGTVGVENVETTFQILIPVIPKIDYPTLSCGADVLQEFFEDVRSVLQPFQRVNYLKEELVRPPRDVGVAPRLVGAIIGTAAMGVATGAAVTAGIALDTAYQNKRDIAQIRAAMSSTLNAIEALQDATKGLSVVVNDIAKRINDEIIPAINNLQCEVSKTSMRGSLASLFNRWLVVFSPLLESPFAEHDSALLTSSVLRDALNAGLSLGATSDELMSSSMQGLVTVQLMEYDHTSLSVLLLVSIKRMHIVSGAVAYRRSSIMVPIDESSELAEMDLPDYIVRVSGFWYAAGSTCSYAPEGLRCRGSPLTPFAAGLNECLNGNLNACKWFRPSSGSSFMLLGSGILADCTTLSCVCADGRAIRGVNYISTDCEVVSINGDRYRVEPSDAGYFVSNRTITFPVINSANLSFIDTSAMDNIRDSLKQSEEALREARLALSKVSSGGGMSVGGTVAIGCAVTGLIILVLMVVMYLILIGKIPKIPSLASNAVDRPTKSKYDGAYDNPIHRIQTISMEDVTR